jgi:PPM family protein phosphatase
VELMTSGAFARASGLSRKALRLYDQLGLLHPVQVDPVSQYRRYAPGQLEQARLVAWLRRLGMPLASIRAISVLPPAQAAAEIAGCWQRVEAETEARRGLAAFLIGYLSGRDTTMDAAQGTLAVRYAVRSDIGLHRETCRAGHRRRRPGQHHLHRRRYHPGRRPGDSLERAGLHGSVKPLL